MPELPEVETMVRGLRPAMTGRVVEEALILDPFLLQGCAADEFKARVSGATVEAIDRRGKWVVFNLRDNRGIIVIQPRMTGGFWLVSPERLDHARLTFRMRGSGQTIWFCDNRRLGKIAWFPDQKSAEQSFQKSHGPDALEVTQDELAEKLGKTSRAIKPTLMDQKVVAGIGNIYADEILFASKIHPERKASDLKRAEIARIHQAIDKILQAAILAEGSSFDAGYRTVLGLDGGFLAHNAM